MHLGILCNEYPPYPHGGIGSSNHDLAEGLVGMGHHVTVIGIYLSSPQQPPGIIRETINGVSVIRMYVKFTGAYYKLWSYITRWRIRRLFQEAQANRPLDLIETADYGGWLPWGGPKGVPVVARLQGTHALFDKELGRTGNSFQYAMEKRGLRRADYWLGISEYSFNATLQICGLKSFKGDVIYHAVDTDFFSPQSDAVEPGLIVYVNVLNPKKGIEQLVDAVNLTFGKYPQARLVAIGRTGAKGEGNKTYPEVLLERVRPDYRERVTFTGGLDRHTGVLPWLRKAQICCYPSHIETFGIAPVEAMALGKPTIFSRTGPGAEVIEHGVSGLLCNPRDPQDIAASLERLLEDPQWAKELGRNARERVVQRFAKKDWLQKNLNFFQRCVSGGVPERT